ncbi:MAG: UvrD-helicase domain-containing protein, partial [Lachnospiraceae bacterium]|nr:UvrD-helicase domain-containing protein [Lachnospiraceae bacterium]
SLIRYIYDRHSYFLIDEFQDTDPLQAQIFFYLSSENPDPVWYECKPKPGSLFIVGDPKQSIYRFKGADVASFLNVRSLMEKTGGAVLKLCCNFRSRTPLLEYFNRVFMKMLPEDTDIQSKYDEIPIISPAREEFQGIYKYYIPSKNEIEKGADPLDDPSVICGLIQTLHDNENYKIIDQKGQQRKLTYNDFMVITYSKNELAPVMNALDEAGIPMRVEGSVQFRDNEALMALLDIYKAVADPSDRIALYGALHGRIFGIKDHELTAYEDTYHMLSIVPPKKAEVETDAAGHVRTVLETLNSIYRRSQQLSPSGLFSLLMEELEIFRYVSAENLEVLYYTLELMRKAEISGMVISPKDGSRYLSALAEETRKEERCLRFTDREDCVHMANLHKVKGLEAPVVILASKGNRINPPDRRVEHDLNGSDAYIFRVKKPGGRFVYLQTSEFTEEAEAEKEVSVAEQKRLAYVAATRAKNVLIIGERKSSKWKELMDDQMKDAKLSLLSAEPQEPGELPEIAEKSSVDDLYQSAKDECILTQKRDAETASFELCNPSRKVHPIRLDAEPLPEDTTENTPEEEPEKELQADGALLGTLVHRMMELLVSGRNQMDGEQ